jgi:NAD(P)-dependent dehydrogenase (short-subunit alcohol dehydrogenase family)
MKLENRIVMITGAAGNLGRATAAAFIEHGAIVVLLDRQLAQLEEICGPGSDRQMLLEVDLLDQPRVDAAARAAIARHGCIDVLCNIAGGFAMGPAVHETPDESWALMMDLNAQTLIHAVRAVVPAMIAAGTGKIVNVTAMAAAGGRAGMGAYCVAKSATLRLTESMALELRDKGINVNCVMPSILDTPQNREAMPDADPQLWVAPQALADVIVFLASDAARAVHGAAIPVVGRS